MRKLFSGESLTRVLWVGAVALFAAAEAVVVVAFWKMPNDHLYLGLGTKYLVDFIAVLPAVAGVGGYYSVKRRLSSTVADAIPVLSRQFLYMVVMAYVALIFSIVPLSEALQRFLK